MIQIQRSSHLLKSFPPQAGATLARALNDAGIELYTDTQFQKITHSTEGFTVTFTHNGETKTRQATHCLNALGRQPNTQALNLKAAGIQTLPSGHIACDAYQRTSNPRVYACGDVAGPHEIVHTAILQGECAAHHATQRKAAPVNYDHLVTVVFTDPQIATVGLNESQLQEKGIDFLTAEYPFDGHGKSILMEAKYGYVKVIAHRDGTILGAECVGKDAGELITPRGCRHPAGQSQRPPASPLVPSHPFGNLDLSPRGDSGRAQILALPVAALALFEATRDRDQ